MEALDPPAGGKLIFAGDWHQNTRWAQRMVLSAAETGVDTIIHTGDFLAFGRKMDEYLMVLNKTAREREIKILFVDGNHENHPYLLGLRRDEQGIAQLTSNIFHLGRGTRWEWEGVRFCALGGATSLDKNWRDEGLDWFREEAITYGQAIKVMQDGPTDVLITHDCPEEVVIPGLWNGWPVDALQIATAHRHQLRMIVDSLVPVFLFHGHFHKAYSYELPLYTGDRCLVRGLAEDGTTEAENLCVTSLDELYFGMVERRA